MACPRTPVLSPCPFIGGGHVVPRHCHHRLPVGFHGIRCCVVHCYWVVVLVVVIMLLGAGARSCRHEFRAPAIHGYSAVPRRGAHVPVFIIIGLSFIAEGRFKGRHDMTL
jgi:hypothetical protein